MNYQFESLGPTLRIVVLVFLLVFALLLLGMIVLIAILPGRIARARSHPQAEAIAVCGWVGLPSGILWAIALVWAFVRPAKTADSNLSSDSISELFNRIQSLECTVSNLESQRRGEVQS
jgi:hypothetical protein